MPPFYPDPVFGWTFYAVLLGFLIIATYTDIGSLKIPKKLTLSMLAVGIVVSLVRGVWMGAILSGSGSDEKVWLFASSPALGALDGLLCALSGFAAGFGVFWVLWLLGVMGGGDLKLMAALGAWVGPRQMMGLLFGSVVVYLLLGTVRLLQKLFRRGVQKTAFNVQQGAKTSNLKKTPAGARRKDQLLAYSLPVAIATGLILPFFVLYDQRHPVPPKDPPSEHASAQP